MEPRSVYELFHRISATHAQDVAYRHKHEGHWIDVTWAEQRETVTRLARSLIHLGIGKGDRVAILSNTRLEWVQCDLAVTSCGGVTVGIYQSNLAEECRYVIDHCGATLIVVENEDQLEKIQSVRSQLPSLRRIVIFDGASDEGRGVLGWEDFLSRGEDVDDAKLEQVGGSVGPDDLAALVYTSGTTGVPKGVMISHGNLLFAAQAGLRCLRVESGDTTLLFLPLAHVFARLIVYLGIAGSLTIAFAENLNKIADNLKDVRPDFILSAPRIYEKFHEKIVANARQAGGVKARLFDWAVGVGHRVSALQLQKKAVPLGLRLAHGIADRLVLRKVRAALGGRLRWAVSGSAPLNTRVAAYLCACGIPILEGLGMTENTSLSNVNRIDDNKLGTVGPVVPGVEMKLAPDGEVLFRGPNVMKGYYENPGATAETIDPDGWLHTGDIGEIDDDGFLKITDRKKDLIITAGGKNIAPLRIEKTIGASRYISWVVAYGDRRKYVSALITLDADNIRQWAGDQSLGSASLEELAGCAKVTELIRTEVAERNQELASFETVKKFRILPRELTVESGELTPSLKVRRKAIVEKYRSLLDEMYQD